MLDSEDPQEIVRRYRRMMAEHAEETRQNTERLSAEIEELINKRYKLRMDASISAGEVGLRYEPESNTCVRIVAGDGDELPERETLERRPPAPTPLAENEEPPPLPRLDITKTSTEIGHSKAIWMGELLLWALVLPIGAAVGVGLATIAGLPWQRESGMLAAAMIIGVSVVAGLKLFLSFIWANAGREKALGNLYRWPLVTAAVGTLLGCAIEAHLGALALIQYSRMRAFKLEDALQYTSAYPMALAITTPLLLAAAAWSWKKGQSEPTVEQRENARIGREQEEIDRRNRMNLEAYEKTKAENAATKQRDIEKQEEYEKQRNEDEANRVDAANKERREAADEKARDWDSLKNRPEYKCLQALVGQIASLTTEINERERRLTNYKISRGFERTAKASGRNGAPDSRLDAESKPEEMDSDVATPQDVHTL